MKIDELFIYQRFMIRYFAFLIVIFFLHPEKSISQSVDPTKYFRSPIDYNIIMSGTFGELRRTHFHAGLDLSGAGIYGRKLYAMANGYVSRIKVYPDGYGRALFITHPNGLVTVYGHLQKYGEKIAKFVKQKQYENEEFDLDIYPDSLQFPVKKGEIVGYMGNAGHSYGVHLHFEIRNEKSENPINPFIYGFTVKDTISPSVFSIMVYPQDDSSYVNAQNKKQSFNVMRAANGGFYVPKPINVNGRIGLGIEAFDFINGYMSRTGVFSIKLYADNNLIYSHLLDEISYFEYNNYYSFIDYGEYIAKKRFIQKSFIEPNTKSIIYKKAINRGIFDFNDNKIHKLKYELSDFKGNISYLNFNIKSAPFVSKPIQNKDTGNLMMYYDKKNQYKTADFSIVIDTNRLFDNLKFTHYKAKTTLTRFSHMHYVQDYYTPLNDSVTIGIKPENLPEKYHDKAIIAQLDDKGKMTGLKSYWDSGFVKTYYPEFGRYFVVVDSIPPVITAQNIYNEINMTISSEIRFKITDQLSGIKSYKGYIDDKWVLFEYDWKNDLITYQFDEKVKRNQKHKIVLKVEDYCNNQAVYKAIFFK